MVGNYSDGVMCLVPEPTRTKRSTINSFDSVRTSIRPSGSSDGTPTSSLLSDMTDFQVKLYHISLEEDLVNKVRSSSESISTIENSRASGVDPHIDESFGISLGFISVEDQDSWAKALSIASVAGLEHSDSALVGADGHKATRQSGPMSRAFKKFLWQLLT